MIRVHVGERPEYRGVEVFFVEHAGDQLETPLRLRNAEGVYTEIDGESVPVDRGLQLSEVEARALLDGLQRHFHGAEDTRSLRRDYDAERARVDRLIDTVSRVSLSTSQVTER